MNSKTFCILPWMHFYANPDGNVLPCCIGDHNRPLGNVQDDSIIKIWNSQQYKSMRLKMLAGEQCNECTACYRAEAAGVKSFRESANIDYSEYLDFVNETNADGSLNSMKLKYLDIRWSNICNFKCRSCSSTYSSTWATEDNKYGQNKKVFIFAGGKDNNDLYTQIIPHLSEIKEIYFAGGEPLLMDKHYEILQHLIDIKNTEIKIKYNSNLSSLVFKNISIIDLWKKFSNIQLNISLDSWEQRAEYIREGTDWQTIKKHILLIRKECPHIQIGIDSVISLFNVYTIPEFINYMIENNLVDNKTSANFYCLLNPNFYSFSVLDNKLKEKITNRLSNIQYDTSLNFQIENVIKHLNLSKQDLNLQKQFKRHTEYYDTIRNRKFVETFPELKEFYLGI